VQRCKYPKDKVNIDISLGVIHNDKVIIITDAKGGLIQANIPEKVNNGTTKSFEKFNLEWEVIETPFPKDSLIHIGNFLDDIFYVFSNNKLYFYNSTRKNWTLTTKLEPSMPYGEYPYHGKQLMASFAESPESDNFNTYFLVVNPTATADELQFVPIVNPHNKLSLFAPYTPLNVLIDLQNPTEPTARLRYINLDRFIATNTSDIDEWKELPLPYLLKFKTLPKSITDTRELIYTKIMIISGTIILLSLSGVYYLKNPFESNQDLSLLEWQELEIFTRMKDNSNIILKSHNIFNIRDITTNEIIIKNREIIPISILNSEHGQLENATFIVNIDARLIYITLDEKGNLVGKEMITFLPMLMVPEILKSMFEKYKFCNKYKVEYLSYYNERFRLDFICDTIKEIMAKPEYNNLTKASASTSDSTSDSIIINEMESGTVNKTANAIP
jgi:hypothetical protein